MTEIDQLQKAIAMLEAQRGALGDAVVNAALAPLQQKLASLRQDQTGESGQRKLVTVLFADLVDFTRMGEQMDPEDVREVMQAYFTRWTEHLEAYGGVIEKFIGDAVMAVFGLHTAREDDSERAVRAALAMRDALDELNDHLEVERGVRLSMRVGIHTGQVVVSLLGERRGQDFVVIGDTVNLANRLQSAAPVNQILISQDTFRLVRGRFDVRPLDPLQVKGRSEPVLAYVVVRAKRSALRLESTRANTPIVGRESEQAVLHDFLRRAIDRRKQQAVIILGEAGMGKTRLIEDFEIRLELLPEVIRYFKGRASPYLQTQPYALVRDLFAFRFNIEDDEAPDVLLEKLLSNLGDRQSAALIARLLGFVLGDGHESVPHDAQQMRDRALAAMTAYFQKSAGERPLVVVLDDMQWADESSLDVIEHLQSELAGLPILWVIAGRPDLLNRRPLWGEEQPFRARFDLRVLTREESRQMLNRLLPLAAQPGPDGALPPQGDLPEEVETLITGSAEGNPFYLEELLRMFVEDRVILPGEGHWSVDPDRLAAVRIPATLTEFLQARLDSLPVEERALLQRAAVVGRIFWDQAVDFLRQNAAEVGLLAGQPTGVVLERLRQFDLILRRDTSSFEGALEYRFTHNLFRDVTYESLLRRQRRIYHAHAARWLEEVTERGQRTGEYAAQIAEHYELANEPEAAVAWYRRAGDLAAARFANAEAVHSYSRALDLLSSEDLPARFELLLAREKIHDHQGHRGAQTADIDELERIAAGLGSARQAQASLRRANLYFMLDDNPNAIQKAQEVVPLAHQAGLERLETEAHLLWGRALLWQSEHHEANRRLEIALEQARAQQQTDLEAACLWNLGIVTCNVGNYPAAHHLLQEAIHLYRQLGDQSGEAVAFAQQGVVYYSQSDYANAQACFEASLDIFHAIGHRSREATVLNNLGAIAHEQGNYSASERLHTRALALYRATGDRYGVSTTGINLCDCLRDLGEYEGARVAMTEAYNVVQETGDQFVATSVNSSICLFYIHTLDLDQAVQAGERALAAYHESGAIMYGSSAFSRMATACLLQGRLDEAESYFNSALELQERLGMENNPIETRAGLAAVALARGDLDAACQMVDALLPLLETNPLNGCDEPARIYLNVYTVLRAANHARAGEFLRRGQDLIRSLAARMDDAAKRRSFLENVHTNRELLELK